MRENTGQNNFEYGHFSRSAWKISFLHVSTVCNESFYCIYFRVWSKKDHSLLHPDILCTVCYFQLELYSNCFRNPICSEMTLRYCKNDKKRRSRLSYNQDIVTHSEILDNMKPSLMTSYHKSKSNGHLLENSLIHTHRKEINERPKSGSRVCRLSFIDNIGSTDFNSLTRGVHKRVVYTKRSYILKQLKVTLLRGCFSFF